MAPRKARSPVKAYQDDEFLNRSAGRPLRILAEYVEPDDRLERHNIADTIVFMGSARLVPREEAERALESARGPKAEEKARMQLFMSGFYETASDLAERLTRWSKELKDEEHRYVVCTGGGPGVMEAANRGASRAKGINMGMSISIPDEQSFNRFITRELSFHFHYFFMRKFWLAYLAKAVIFFPGGYGTLDELFEFLTLLKTKKFQKHLPIVLFGRQYWEEIVDFDALVRYGTIDKRDRDLFIVTDSVDEAFDYITDQLQPEAEREKGATL